MPTDLTRLAARFRHFAAGECPQDPLYEALCRIVAADAHLLGLLSDTSDEQQRPNLWLAAVHEQVLAGSTHPLAAYFASVGGTRVPDAQLADCVKDFVASHEHALCERMRTQTTQTNEIGRCAVLWPALHAIARRSGKTRLALLDLGCSAGLNLGVDAYRYDYGGAVMGAPAQPGVPTIECRLVGPRPMPPEKPLHIVQRRGIDPSPIAVDDAAAFAWLRACLWPNDGMRALRFNQAATLMKQHRWPVLRVADCTAHVGEWLDSVPGDAQAVVFNSWVLTYFEPAALQRHISTLVGHVEQSGAMWLSAESPQLHIGPVNPPLPAEPDQRQATQWTLCSRQAGAVRFEVLARSHPHGRWLEWLDN